jgi:hypothetical protein
VQGSGLFSFSRAQGEVTCHAHVADGILPCDEKKKPFNKYVLTSPIAMNIQRRQMCTEQLLHTHHTVLNLLRALFQLARVIFLLLRFYKQPCSEESEQIKPARKEKHSRRGARGISPAWTLRARCRVASNPPARAAVDVGGMCSASVCSGAGMGSFQHKFMSQCSFTHNALQQLQLCLLPHLQRNKSSINPSSSTSSSYSPPLPPPPRTLSSLSPPPNACLRPFVNGSIQCESIESLLQQPVNMLSGKAQ